MIPIFCTVSHLVQVLLVGGGEAGGCGGEAIVTLGPASGREDCSGARAGVQRGSAIGGCSAG